MGLRETRNGAMALSLKGDDFTTKDEFEYSGRRNGKPSVKVLTGRFVGMYLQTHRNHFDPSDTYNRGRELRLDPRLSRIEEIQRVRAEITRLERERELAAERLEKLEDALVTGDLTVNVPEVRAFDDIQVIEEDQFIPPSTDARSEAAALFKACEET